MIYLDSAAVVKLVHAESESGALRDWLGERAETGWISSVLTEIESFRALARYAPEAVSRLPAVLDQIDLAPACPECLGAIRRATILSPCDAGAPRPGSQTGSQRRQDSGDAERRPPTISAGRRDIKLSRHSAW